MKYRKLPVLATFVAALGLVLAACGGNNNNASSSTTTTSSSSSSGSGSNKVEKPPSTPVSLSETGSTLLFPLFQLWAPAYNHLYPNITITAQGTGSGTGIAQATAGAVDIGASDAYLPPATVQQTPSLKNIPLAISAQEINYNLSGVTNLKLSAKVLSEIYQGTITTWNDPAIAKINPGVTLPATKIVPLHRSDGSGDTFLFTSYLSAADPSGWGTKIGKGTTVSFPAVPGALGENGNGGMVTGCAATPGCVAYIGISYQSQASGKGLGEAKISNASGNYLLPTPSTIKAEAAEFASKTPPNGTISMIYGTAPQGYPIINYEYAIVNSSQSDPTKAQAIRAFLGWAITSGNSATFLDQVNFQPLPSQVVTQSFKQISSIK